MRIILSLQWNPIQRIGIFLGPEESLVRFICSNLVNITRVSFVLNSTYFGLVMARPGAGIS